MKEKLDEVFKYLDIALSVGRYGSWRQRFASVEQWKEEGPYINNVAYSNWFIAKRLIMENREEFAKYISSNLDSIRQLDLENYNAAVKVTEQEMRTELENLILGGYDG